MVKNKDLSQLMYQKLHTAILCHAFRLPISHSLTIQPLIACSTQWHHNIPPLPHPPSLANL